jgi:glycosyltransferase involved in cell wall biosynthesis/SAM-dependent methyltransferase
MHICQISKDFNLINWDETSEPCQRQYDYLICLKKKYPKAQMTIIVIYKGQSKPSFIKNDIRIIPVKDRFFNRVINIFFVIRKLNKVHPINIITTQNPYDEAWGALAFSKIFKVPAIAQIHFDIFNKEAIQQTLGKGLIGKIRFILFKRLIRYFNAIRVVGTRIKKDIISQKLADPKRIFVLPVTVPLVATAINNKKAYHSNPHPSVLFVGRLVPPKNLFFWLDVAAFINKHLPTVNFDIVGDGYLKGELQDYADKIGISNNINFHGEVANHLLKDYYDNAGLFLITSTNEGFGRVILEAGAFGLPMVSTKNTGAEDIITPGYNGYLFEVDDKEGIANCVIELLNNPEKRKQTGENNHRHIIENYQAEKLKQEWVDLWISLLPDLPVSMKMIRKRTWPRWKKIWASNSSLWRTLTYDIVEEIELTGLTLDIGAGKKNSYHHLLKNSGEIETINIDPGVDPTYVFDLNKPISLASSSYDNVISLNTFEHIYQDELAISEAIRLLKPGGSFHFFVPFLYKIHAEPNDYHRQTGFWWNRKLVEYGLDQHNFNIDSICWNKKSTIQSAAGKPLSKIKKLLLIRDVIRDSKLVSNRLNYIPQNALYLNYPLGYYIYGVKH